MKRHDEQTYSENYLYLYNKYKLLYKNYMGVPSQSLLMALDESVMYTYDKMYFDFIVIIDLFTPLDIALSTAVD